MWGNLMAHTDVLAVVTAPVHTTLILGDGQCAGLNVGILKVEPEI
jgi:hypothetical protein